MEERGEWTLDLATKRFKWKDEAFDLPARLSVTSEAHTIGVERVL